jgi:shikimate dehydrogenase
LLAPHHIVFDCVYGRRKLRCFAQQMKPARAARTGLSMLLHQGALSFSIWFNREAPIEAMRSAIAL